MYRISVYINVDKSFGEEMIVSFHEDNIRGVAKTNALIKNKRNRLVPVFADSYGSIDMQNGICKSACAERHESFTVRYYWL